MVPHSIIVTGLPDQPGAVLKGTELIAAVEVAQRARALGLEGKVLMVYEDQKIEEFDLDAKTRAVRAELPWSRRQVGA